MTLFPHDDIEENHGVTWRCEADKKSAELFKACGHLGIQVPEWDDNRLFSYIVLGRLPMLPIQCDFDKYGIGDQKKLYKMSMSVLYPLTNDKLLDFYKNMRDEHNHPNRRVFNFNPPSLREFDIVLLELVFKMPIEEHNWSDRLQVYLKEYNREIKASFLPDFGLYKEGGSKNWNNAMRNMSRDYKRVLAKLV